MDEGLSLDLSVYEGYGLTPENGWNVLVIARLEEMELSTSPVPLTSQPKFDEEMSWDITSDTLSMLRQSGNSVLVECLAWQKQGGKRHSIGHALLPLPSPTVGIKTEAKWHSLIKGPRSRVGNAPSLLLSLNLSHKTGVEVVDEFRTQKPNQKSTVERGATMASLSEQPELKAVNTDIFSKLRRAGEGCGNAATLKRLASPNRYDEIELMEESDQERHDSVITIEDQGNGDMKGRSAQSNMKSCDSFGVQDMTNSLYGHSVSGSCMKGASFRSQSQPGRKGLHQSAFNSLTVKENGHRSDPQPSSSKSNDVVALPSASEALAGAPAKLRAIPLLNAQGSYFQIGLAGEPGEQMFEYSVTIVFAKFLDQLVPPDMEIRETENTTFCYSLLSHFVYGEPIKDLGRPDFQAENAMGRICSTVHNLSEYFMQHPDLPINLTVGDVCLATASVGLSQFASSILTGGLPVQVEGGYPLVPNLFSPLGWKPKGEPVVGIIVNLATSVEQEISVLPFPPGVRDAMNSDRGFHPVLDVSSASSTRTLSDSQDDSAIEWVDQGSRNHGTVARLGNTRRHKKRRRTWAQKERRLQMAALEVEKWKENEQESVRKQWNIREAELQQHLAQEWESHMSSMENQLQQRLEQCHALHKRLTEGLYALESREGSLGLKEESIKVQKDELKVRKAELKRLLSEVNKLSKKERERVEQGEIVNLQQQLMHEKRQRRLLQRQVRELEAAKRTAECAKDALRLGNQIKDEDIDVLKRDKERLQEELSACCQKKKYYKMQWVKAVGQVNQARAEMNSYRVDIEKTSLKSHFMQPQAKNSIQYKDDRQSDRRKLRSLPEHVAPEEGRKESIAGMTTDPKKFVKDLLKERKGLRDMVAKRKRIEEDEAEKDNVNVLVSPGDVRRVHSLLDR